MFDLDKWSEIYSTISKSKLRTFLTAFSIAWGIFMLVVLLGVGSGLLKGVEYHFRDDATNTIWVRPGQTSMPYRGIKPGKRITLTNIDHDQIVDTVDGVEHITSRYFLRGEFFVRYKNNFSLFGVRATHPGHKYIEKTVITEGRYLNDLDISEHRKITVIGLNVVKKLFKNEDPIGEWIDINGIKYKVVGIYKDLGHEWEMDWIYIPITTAQMAYNGANRVHQIILTTGNANLDKSNTMAANIKDLLVERHIFSPDDSRAITVQNFNEVFQRYLNMITGIKAFIWLVGLGTIAAGIVGVSNVMLIVVRERTREIGIRKAIGATPKSIIGLILQESITVTMVAGYFGLVAGVAFIEMFSWALEAFDLQGDFFRNPEFDFKSSLMATFILVFAGALAGFFPAKLAAQVKPVEALREE